MGYRRSSNAAFNIHLSKVTRDRKPSQTNIEKAEANIDAWLADLEAKKASGEQSDFVRACNKNLAEYSKPHGNVWWAWTIVKNRAYRIWVELVRRGK